MLTDFPIIKIEKLRVKSKAGGILSFLEANKPIKGEKFDLGLDIKNLTQETFKNGYISSTLRYAKVEAPSSEVRFPFDELKPNERTNLWAIDQIALSSGVASLHNFNLVCEGKLVARGDYVVGSTIPCHSFVNSKGQAIDKDNPINFTIASKEEIYEKYGAIIAFVTLIIALITLILYFKK